MIFFQKGNMGVDAALAGRILAHSGELGRLAHFAWPPTDHRNRLTAGASDRRLQLGR
jgi:hypothetical protein